MKTDIGSLTIAFAVLFSISACSQHSTNAALQPSATPPKADSPRNIEVAADGIKANINGREALLSDHKGKCRLTIGEKVVDLDLPGGCDFHRLPNKEVRIFPKDVYKNPGKIPKSFRNITIVLIEHSVPNDQNSKECQTQLQAVKIEGGQIAKSVLMQNLASCPPIQWDAKNFTALFEEKR